MQKKLNKSFLNLIKDIVFFIILLQIKYLEHEIN